MQFQADEYYRAGVERIDQARRIYHQGNSFALAMYCAGLAVECLLRGFRWQVDQSFEGRHDLRELLKSSKLLKMDEEHLRGKHLSDDLIRDAGLELRVAMNKILILWNNNLRFASETRLKRYLRQQGRLQGIRGDPLKGNASELINAAGIVMERGIALWTSKIK